MSRRGNRSKWNIALSAGFACVVIVVLYFARGGSARIPIQDQPSDSMTSGDAPATVSENSPPASDGELPSPSAIPSTTPQDLGPPLPEDLQAQIDSAPPDLPDDLRQQLMSPPPELPPDLKAQLEAPPPEIPEDIKRALATPPRIVSEEEVNTPPN